MKTLYFVFFELMDDVIITIGTRFSIWLEEDITFGYLMPSQVERFQVVDDFYFIEMITLDDNFISSDKLYHKFFFGHPGRVIGFGILTKIENK